MADFLPLGTPVMFRRPLHRTYEFRDLPDAGQYNYPRQEHVRLWKDWDFGEQRSPWREGIVMGVRTLRNGTITSDYEEGTTFHPEESFQAYLIVFHLRRKPVFVLPEHVKERDA